MSSYGSNHSGYLHPSQYPPNPPAQQQQQQQPQPPYPTTPGPAPGQQSAFFPPAPQNQPMYSTSPASPWQQPNYSSSPASAPQYPFYSSSPGSAPQQPMQHHRRSSSMSQSGPPHFNSGTAPIAIPQQQQQPYGFGQQEYTQHHGSHSSHHSHHPHGHDADSNDGQAWGELDQETLRSYEKRYAKDRKLEKRPTLGGSVISMVRAFSGKRQ
ncbi:hypothetical protein DE146DRAFT_340916 [Phaeosphaeria sp. MPI-PUGE-AT-0046c]|nr:hypothetical protein DE146DRAFT_340916 [Phaeosphaeria sp. MPI-PUGE-AT-0046c]